MSVWHGPRGIQVEVIMLGRKARYRLTHVVNGQRFILAYCRDIAELAQHVDLADLVEVVDLPARVARKAAS